MKRLAHIIESIMMAVTFAESGEHDTAREIMRTQEEQDRIDRTKPSQRPDRTLRASAPPRL
ncbi:MAG: hypothetical protein M0024_10915 [Nitrospiraceae bacterium]|nr:hypothetical protein [Nitrospiraceae bacterium]